jgi:hypothetical protein
MPLTAKILLAGALAALALVVATALGGSTPAPAAAAGHGATHVPPAARGPVSAALGAHDARYRIAGLRAHNPSQHLSAAFSSSGVALRSGRARAALRLVGFGYASAVRRVSSAHPRPSANRVRYTHDHGLDEWYANGPLGLEQGFDVHARPAAGSGPLTLSMRLSRGTRARLDGSGATLTTHGRSLRYGGLGATDARGRALPARLKLDAGRLQIRVDDRRAAYPVRVDPFIQQVEVAAGDGGENDLFGASVDVSGDTLVVGAPGHPTGAALGAAYVFEKPAAGWAAASETAELTISGGAAGGTLGPVAISGDTIVAGADDQTVGNHVEQGAAFVFVKPAGGWKDAHETAMLTASDGTAGAELGTAVDISGDTVVASAPDDPVGGHSNYGTSYVFVKPAEGWSDQNQVARLDSDNGATDEEAGGSVAVSGDTVVVGSDRHQIGGNTSQGDAYVFVKPSSGWTDTFQSAQLNASDGATDDRFGIDVAISGDTVAVGAFNHQVAGSAQQGAAYVFVKPAGGWSGTREQTAELTASNGATADRLGFRVDVSGTRVVATGPVHKVGVGAAQGAAYLFVRPGATWADTTEAQMLTAADGEAGDMLGAGLAFAGNAIVLGAADHRFGSNAAQGAAYVFAAPPSITLRTPGAGATFPRDRVVRASFACDAAAGATIAACAGTVASGTPIDTRTLGRHAFVVNARDGDGLVATRSVTYTVVAPLAIRGLRQSSARWRRPAGTTFSFRLNRRARVTLHFTRRLHGGAVRPAGTLVRGGHAGANRIRFHGRLSPTRRLRPGRYTMRATATSGGEHTSSRRLHFTILR